MVRIRIVSLVLVAIAIGLQSIGSAQESETPFAKFVELSGKVVDSSNKPIKKFRVDIKLYHPDDQTPKVAKQWNAEFKDGRFSFDIEEPIELKTGSYLSMLVTADDYINGRMQYLASQQLVSFEGEFEKTKLKTGLTVKGKLTLPDNSTEEKLVAPSIAIVKKMSGWNRSFEDAFHTRPTVEEDGTFSTKVPENCSVEILAFSPVSYTHLTLPTKA